jgi:hypothetical protein
VGTDLLDTLRELRGRRARPLDPAEVNLREGAIEELLVRAEAVAPPPGSHPSTARPELPADAGGSVRVDADPAPPATEPEPAAPPEVTKPAPRRNRRASVPKWDDIVFGSKRE